jgi:hypothetical protein
VARELLEQPLLQVAAVAADTSSMPNLDLVRHHPVVVAPLQRIMVLAVVEAHKQELAVTQQITVLAALLELGRAHLRQQHICLHLPDKMVPFLLHTKFSIN